MLRETTAQKKIAAIRCRVRIIQGGTSSSKTFSIIPLLINHAIQNPLSEISIVSESVPHLKRGALKDFKKIMNWTGNFIPSKLNRTDMIYTFSNGSTIEFFSADNPKKLRGARRHILFINECNNIDFESYQQLAMRTSEFIYLDYNPTGIFWVHNELQKDKDAETIVLTYKDNEAAPQAAVDEILKAKAKADNGNKFWENWYRVYGLGKTGILQGAIFTNWTIGEYKEIKKSVFGQDFGFSNDPTTLVQTSIDKDNKRIYVKECYSTKHLKTSEIGTLNKEYASRSLIVGDSAEPRLITELKQHCNIEPAIKGQGSIIYGIALLQDYDLIIDPNSLNLIEELRNYVWLDKKSNTPCDAWNHLIDAARYAISYQLANPNRGNYSYSS